MDRARSASGSPRLERALGWLSFAIPLLALLLRIEASSQWSGDLAVVRALGQPPMGSGGFVTSLLGQGLVLLPLGGSWLRLALLGPLAAAASGVILFELTRRLLGSNAASPALAAALAFVASVTTTLAPAWQAAAGSPGGGAVGVALGLGAILVQSRGRGRDARGSLALGLLLALALLEQSAAGLLGLLGVLTLQLGERSLPSWRRAVPGLVGGAVVIGLALLPQLLRQGTAAAATDLVPLFAFPGAGEGRPGLSGWAGVAWQRESGLVTLVLAAGGAAWGLLRGKTRPLLLGWVAMVGIDLLTTRGGSGAAGWAWLAELGTATRLYAVAGVAMAAALGVQTLALGLRRARLPFARAAAALLVVLDFTFALVAAEEAWFSEPHRESLATEVFTDEALAGLPPRAVVLLRSEAMVWRLRAAAVLRGERPDLLLVPLGALGRAPVARRLLEREPQLGALLRDVAVQGRPGEYALSGLADARPLFVEVDPGWDRRLFAHLMPGGMWLRFLPHALGRSDRVQGIRRGQSSFERVRAAVGEPGSKARPATRRAFARRLREQAVVLIVQGDFQAAGELLELLGAEVATDPMAALVAARAAGQRTGTVDIAAWLP